MTKSGTGGSGGRRRAAFSLVELMAVVAAIGIIASLILPAIQASRESARRTQCLTNLRQTGIGLQLHHDVHGLFPPRNPGNNLKLPHAVLHWPALILPFIEEDALWSEAVQACDIDPLAYRVPPHTVNKAVVKLFICPTAPQLTRPVRLPDQNEV